MARIVLFSNSANLVHTKEDIDNACGLYIHTV